MNYLIVIALICEFCNQFVFSVFDTIICQYGILKHHMISLEFSLLSSLGSSINLAQTGLLFSWLLNTLQLSIPSIGSLAGIVECRACVRGVTRSRRVRVLHLRQPRGVRRGQRAPPRRVRLLRAHRADHIVCGCVTGA